MIEAGRAGRDAIALLEATACHERLHWPIAVLEGDAYHSHVTTDMPQHLIMKKVH